MAYKNKTKTLLTEQILNEIGGHPKVVQNQKFSNMEIIKRKLSSFSTANCSPIPHQETWGDDSASLVLLAHNWNWVCCFNLRNFSEDLTLSTVIPSSTPSYPNTSVMAETLPAHR
jgi:hypothetical protein